MARKTVQKQFTITEVKGFMVENGAPVMVSYQLDRKCGINTAQSIIRKTVPSFSATEVVNHSKLYKMDFETFKQHATEVIDVDPNSVVDSDEDSE